MSSSGGCECPKCRGEEKSRRCRRGCDCSRCRPCPPKCRCVRCKPACDEGCDCADCRKKPCCPEECRGEMGPEGKRGLPGRNGTSKPWFDERATRYDLTPTFAPIVSVVVGDASSPARTLSIFASFSAFLIKGVSNAIPLADFAIQILPGFFPELGGATLTFDVDGGGETGAIVRANTVPAGPVTVQLLGRVRNLGEGQTVRIDPSVQTANNPRTEATLLVLESFTS